MSIFALITHGPRNVSLLRQLQPPSLPLTPSTLPAPPQPQQLLAGPPLPGVAAERSADNAHAAASGLAAAGPTMSRAARKRAASQDVKACIAGVAASTASAGISSNQTTGESTGGKKYVSLFFGGILVGWFYVL